MPKILVVDIETCPGEAYVWNQKTDYIAPHMLIRPGHIISIGWKWMGGKTWYRDAWPFDDKASRKEMLQTLRAHLVEADAVVSYNGASFDLPRINGEFVYFGLAPVPKVPHIDLYRTVRGLGYWSGKLEYVLKHLGEGEKMGTGGFDLWRGYMAEDRKARAKMKRYNLQDVNRTAALYTRLAPYIKTHPRLHDHPNCPSCGSNNTQARGYRRLEFFKVQRHQCQNCAKWFEGRRSKI